MDTFLLRGIFPPQKSPHPQLPPKFYFKFTSTPLKPNILFYIFKILLKFTLKSLKSIIFLYIISYTTKILFILYFKSLKSPYIYFIFYIFLKFYLKYHVN
jgi:hypothetical protein